MTCSNVPDGKNTARRSIICDGVFTSDFLVLYAVMDVISGDNSFTVAASRTAGSGRFIPGTVIPSDSLPDNAEYFRLAENTSDIAALILPSYSARAVSPENELPFLRTVRRPEVPGSFENITGLHTDSDSICRGFRSSACDTAYFCGCGISFESAPANENVNGFPHFDWGFLNIVFCIACLFCRRKAKRRGLNFRLTLIDGIPYITLNALMFDPDADTMSYAELDALRIIAEKHGNPFFLTFIPEELSAEAAPGASAVREVRLYLRFSSVKCDPAGELRDDEWHRLTEDIIGTLPLIHEGEY